MRSHADGSSTQRGNAGSLGRPLAVLVAIVGVLFLLNVADASAAKTHVFEGEVGNGELSQAASLAVDQASGELYVADPISGSIRRYDSSGSPAEFSATGTNSLGPLVFGGFGEDGSASQIAVDNSGASSQGRIYAVSEGQVRAFDPSGEPAAEPVFSNFFGVCGVAVDTAGNVYLASNGSMAVVDPAGQLLVQASLPFGFYCGIDVDSTGVVYAAGYFGHRTVRMVPDSQPVTSATSYEQQDLMVADAYGLTVDRNGDNLYVDGNGSVAQYGPAATGNDPITTFGADDLGTGSRSVVVDASGGPANGDVYVSDGSRVVRFGPLVTVPGPSIAAASNVDGNTGSVTLNGSVDPAGLAVTSCEFEYGYTLTYGHTTPCLESPAQIGDGNAPVSVHADLAGLESGLYHFRLVAANANGSLRSADGTFALSDAETLAAQQVSKEGARLRARIRPFGLPTSYQFEYGSDPGYGSLAFSQPVYAGTQEASVSRFVAGLRPNATYHYRVVIFNARGTVWGEDRTFTTDAIDPPGRAYEQVSPVQKGGIDARGFFGSAKARISPSGNTATFSAPGSFGGTEASLVGTTYLSSRSPAGWSTRSLSVPQRAQGSRFEAVIDISSDLSHTVVSSKRVLAPGAIEDDYNVYLRDTETGQTELIFTTPDQNGIFGGFYGVLQGTPDFSRIYFTETHALTPDAPSNEWEKLYEFSQGKLRLASVMPDGAPATEPVAFHEVRGGRGPIASADGRRVFFELGTSFSGSGFGGLGLYMREDGHTVPISVSQRSGDGPEVQPAMLAGLSDDGNFVYFLSPRLLTDDSIPHQESLLETGDLYRYEVDTGELINVTATSDPINVNGANLSERPVLAVSGDGRSVYFQAFGKLTPDAPFSSSNAGSTTTNLYVWHEGDVDLLETVAYGAAPAPEMKLSPSGRLAVYSTVDVLERFTSPNPARCQDEGTYEGRCRELVFFDAETGESECISCGNGLPGGNADMGTPRSTAITDRGQVFFNSPDRLVSGDRNGYFDAYEWRLGELSLISTGRAESDSLFTTANKDGRDVLFVTSERLVGQDTDDLIDVYDAREGGGIATQSAPRVDQPCKGEGCLPAVQVAPGLTSIASATASGGSQRALRCRSAPKSKAKRRNGKRRHRAASSAAKSKLAKSCREGRK